jgi:methylated-DNA-protein-cysteine methyltransferase-like protein
MMNMRFESDKALDNVKSSKSFADQVRKIVASVPRGKVITYGDIALAIGAPRNARRVGWVLNGLPSGNAFPCHRVVNRNGYLSGGWMWGHPDIMKKLLLDENVPFKDEYTVDLEKCRWFPADDEELAAADEMDDFDFIASFDRD